MARAISAESAERVDQLQGMILAGQSNTACITSSGLGISHAKQLEMFAGSGAEPQGSRFTHTN